jgi:predicted fused transcriptional regulator/phosphomethylpyrimidine kinase
MQKTRLISGLSFIGMNMKDPGRERSDVLEKLSTATALLERSMDIRLIPKNGARLAYAIRGARDKNGVAAVKGGIILEHGNILAGGPCAFGADEEIARILLTVMKFDPHMQCVATLRYSGNMLKIIDSLFLECTSFDPQQNPPGSVQWTGGLHPVANREFPMYAMIQEEREKKGLYVFLVKIQSTYRTILL